MRPGTEHLLQWHRSAIGYWADTGQWLFHAYREPDDRTYRAWVQALPGGDRRCSRTLYHMREARTWCERFYRALREEEAS